MFIHFEENKDTSFIDVWTSKYLKLTDDASVRKRENLFSIVDFTSTKNGMKTLKANILEPPACNNSININISILAACGLNIRIF